MSSPNPVIPTGVRPSLYDAAIDFIYTESADQVFYWDSKTKAFREIAMSD